MATTFVKSNLLKDFITAAVSFPPIPITIGTRPFTFFTVQLNISIFSSSDKTTDSPVVPRVTK